MKNSDEIKNNFLQYVEKFDSENPKMHRKIWHSVRVSENSKNIAKSLNLNEEEINVAEIIGMLHDLGKLEQINDEKYKEIEHGKFAVDLLKNNSYIREYIETDKYDNIIFKAIENHGLFTIKNGLAEKELLFAKIIRDADKLDIFYEATEMFWTTEEQKNKVEKSELSEEYLKQFKEKKSIYKKQGEKKNSIDGVVNILSFIFDINFKYDFTILQKEDYINKILNKFDFTNEKTKKQIEEVRLIANGYIEEKITK